MLIDSIRKSLKPDGTWLCADIKGRRTFAENMKDNPIATLAYSFSVMGRYVCGAFSTGRRWTRHIGVS
jgi:hypothetical protein